MLDDFKPKKPPVTTSSNDIDREIGDAFAPPQAVAALDSSDMDDEPIVIDNDDPIDVEAGLQEEDKGVEPLEKSKQKMAVVAAKKLDA